MDREPLQPGRRKGTPPLPTRFGRNKRRLLPRPRLFGRDAGEPTSGEQRSAAEDETPTSPPARPPRR